MLPSTSKTAGKQLISNAQNLIKTKAMMVQKMSGPQLMNARGLQASEQQQVMPKAGAKEQSHHHHLVFSEMLNKQFMDSASFHQMREKVNVQQIMRELGDKRLGAKEMSTDFFLDSLFRRKDQKEEAVPEGETIDTDPSDLEFRKRDEGGSEEMLVDDQDTATDLEFDDHWGVERRGEQPLTSDQDEDDSDEDGGELMPVFF